MTDTDQPRTDGDEHGTRTGDAAQFEGLFETVTGTTELVTEQETGSDSRCLEDDQQISSYVAGRTGYESLSDALGGADTDENRY